MGNKTTALENLKEFAESDLISGIVTFLNSGFLAACAGAFGGAVAANWFAKRNDHERMLREHLSATNMATSTAIAVFQNSIGFKKQLSQQTILQFRQDKEKFENFLAEKTLGLGSGKIHLNADFQSIPLFKFDAGAVEKTVAERCSPKGQVILAAVLLTQTLHGLELAVRDRQEQLDRLSAIRKHAVKANEEENFWKRYFGLELDDGVVDLRLVNAIDAMETHLDDSIHYSLYIATELGTQSKSIARKLGDKSPSAVSFKLDPDKVDPYLPNTEDYPKFPITIETA